MKAAGIRIFYWDKVEYFAAQGKDLKQGEVVIVKTSLGLEDGEVVYPEKEFSQIDLEESKQIQRRANLSDLETIKRHSQKKIEALKLCRQFVKKYNLPMKLVDLKFSFDGSRITFAFTADGRIDFRELVKDLTRKFQKSIRLQQIGSRDEAKRFGGVGMCGRVICCQGFLKELHPISTEMAQIQQITHRGSTRLSGSCGRLMCCLAFEQKQYEELLKQLPAIGTYVQTPKGKGEVKGWQVLEKKIKVELADGALIDVKIKDLS